MKKIFKSNMISFMITGLIVITASVSAVAFRINSNNVKYRKNNSDVSLKSAVDDLYDKANDCYGYKIGDEITVNGEQYYVIENSPAQQDYVVALKASILTDSVYYTSDTCGNINGQSITTGCTTDYDSSTVKNVVNNWATNTFTHNELKEVAGYSARLPQKEELRKIGWSSCSSNGNSGCWPTSDTPNWLYIKYKNYWTMTPFNASVYVWYINNTGVLYPNNYKVYDTIQVRPVVNVKKQYAVKSSC